jgi:hypothetical protein
VIILTEIAKSGVWKAVYIFRYEHCADRIQGIAGVMAQFLSEFCDEAMPRGASGAADASS